MAVVIENPVLNSPFDPPQRHFHFADDGITAEVVEGRRTSSYFTPIAAPKKEEGQAAHLRCAVDAGRVAELLLRPEPRVV